MSAWLSRPRGRTCQLFQGCPQFLTAFGRYAGRPQPFPKWRTMGNYDIVSIVASFWPFAPLGVLLVVAWFACRPRKPPTI